MSAAVASIRQHRDQLRTVALDEMTIDPNVQRKEGVDQRRVDKMAADFNPDALGVFILSQRSNGSLVVLDGMHRRAAGIAAAHTTYVDAKVYTGLTTAEEASLFLLYNDKKDPSAISKFHARVLAEDATAVEMYKVITANGWTVAQGDFTGCMSAINAAERVYTTSAGTLKRGHYGNILDVVLSVVTESWGHDSDATHGIVLQGLGQLYGRFQGDVDSKKLVSELQQTRPKALIGRAKNLTDSQGGTIPAALARILTSLHNKRRRSNLLPEWVWVR